MSEGVFISLVPELMPAIAAGYLLGAFPLADRVSRRQGIDIFSTGTGLAGASNVLRSVGKISALVVLLGDMGKGALVVLVSWSLGVEGVWVLLPVAAAVVGHWKSLFSHFRGGDGLATLGGATIPLFGAFGVVSVMVAMLIALGGQRMPYSSLVSIVLGYMTLVTLNIAYEGDSLLALGTGGLACLVLAYALEGHWRRRRLPEWDVLEEPEGATEQSGFH